MTPPDQSVAIMVVRQHEYRWDLHQVFEYALAFHCITDDDLRGYLAKVISTAGKVGLDAEAMEAEAVVSLIITFAVLDGAHVIPKRSAYLDAETLTITGFDDGGVQIDIGADEWDPIMFELRFGARQ